MMRTAPTSTSNWLVAILLLGLLAPSASATHDPESPPMFVATEPLYHLEYDPWAGGTWIATQGLMFRGDDGGLSHLDIRDGLPINKVNDVVSTPTALWVNTEIGPAVMDKADGSFRTATNTDGTPFLYEGRTIYPAGDRVWVGTNTEGLFRVDPASMVATPVPNPINGSRFGHQIMDIEMDGSKLFISATGYGLVEWDQSTGATRHFDTTAVMENPIYGRIHVAPDRVWIATSGDGVVTMDRETGDPWEYMGPDTLNARTVRDLTRAGPEYWFAQEAGISRYDARTESWQNWQSMPWGSANGVEVIDGRVYAVTNRGMVIQYDRASDNWVDAHWWGEKQVLPHNSIFSCSTDDGDLVIGTGGGGALRIRPNAWEKIGDPDDPARRPLDITVWDLEVSPETMWFASHKGISRLDRQTDAWSHFRTDGWPIDHPVDNPVRDINVGEDGVWAATTKHTIVRGPDRGEEKPGNLAHLDAQSGVLTQYDQSSGLAGNSVLSVDVAAGRVWIGLENDGLDVMDANTGNVQHVWPMDDSQITIRDISARPDAIWVAASNGLHRVDPITLEITKIEDAPFLAASSLWWDDDSLWVGAIYGDVHRYNPQFGEFESFNDAKLAPSGLCMTRIGSILYVGTQWGIDRLDVNQGIWLPKIGVDSPPSTQPWILVSNPLDGAVYDPGDTVTLRGTAEVPRGAWVEVGVAGEWVRATGTDSWNARFPIDEAYSGPLTLSARIFDGQRVLVQDAVDLTVQNEAGDEARSVEFAHEQVLLAENGSTIPFSVTYEPRDANATGWVEFWPPSAQQATLVPLDSTAPGLLSGSSPVLQTPGEARYRIRLQWDGGQTYIPDLYGSSPSYIVTIQEPVGKPIGFLIAPQCNAGVPPGGSGEVTFGVQNVGTTAGLMQVDFAGPVSVWIAQPPEPFDLPPSQSRKVSVPITVPEGVQPGTYELAIGAGPVKRTAGSVHAITCEFVVGDPETLPSDSEDLPGEQSNGASDLDAPHPGALLGLLAVAVAWARRRGQ